MLDIVLCSVLFGVFQCCSYVFHMYDGLFGRIIRINRVNNRRFCEEKEYFKSFERV